MDTLLSITRVEIYGAIAIIAGFLLVYYVFHKRFKRSGVAGTQYYDSSVKAFAVPAFEGLLRRIGILMILAGLFLIGIEQYNRYSTRQFLKHNSSATTHKE